MATAWRDYLLEFMRRRNMNPSQVAGYLGVEPSTIGGWLRGRQPSTKLCLAFAQRFHEPVEKILRLAGHLPGETYVIEEPPPKSLRERVQEFIADIPVSIPVVEKVVTAGLGGQVLDYVYMARPRLEGRQLENLVALQVRGQSMAPELMDGDYVILELGSPPAPGKLVVATRGEESFVRRYEIRDGVPVLVSNDGQVIEATDVRIEGRVFISIHRHE